MAYRMSRLLYLSAVAVATFVVLLTAATTAQDTARPSAAGGPLDGMVFVGKIGPQGKQNFDEELHFNNGHFWTNNCATCGYQPNIYWIRTAGGDIYFRADLIKAGGSRFRYHGRIADGRAHVTVRWTKHRWYWTIDQVMVFDGVLATAKHPVSIEEARRQAQAASERPLPQWCS